MTEPDEDFEPPEREHVDCGWCDSGSHRDRDCPLAPDYGDEQ